MTELPLSPAATPARGTGTNGKAAARAPLGHSVYEELLTRILSRQAAAGERVTIDALGRELGVSQTPIREALHRLESEGLVVRTHLSGYRVAPPMSQDQFEELVEIRLLLEPAIARNAAERVRPEDLKALQALSSRMAAPTASGEGLPYAVFARHDAELHDRIAASGGNQLMREALTRLHTHVRLFRLSWHVQITAQAVVEHDAILRAIDRRDPDAAAAAMHAHVRASADRFRRSFEPHPPPA